MRRRLLAAALTCVLAAPALAGTGWASFELAYADDDPAVATQIDKDVGARIDRAWAQLVAGARWNEATAGPFGLVKGDATLEHEQPGTGRVRVEISVTPRVAVPSEAASARALAERMLELVRTDIESSVATQRQFAVATRRSELRQAEAATKAAAQAVHQHVAEFGDLDTARDIATTRLREAAADLANTRIERAVTSHRLDASRKAVERAAEAEDLRDQADAAELEMETKVLTPPQRAELQQRLAKLRTLLRDAEKQAPPLEVARRRVFDLEVELVGLEAREALLAPEIERLSAEARAIGAELRKAADLERTAAARRADEEQLVTELRALERASKGPAVVVLQFRSSSR